MLPQPLQTTCEIIGYILGFLTILAFLIGIVNLLIWLTKKIMIQITKDKTNEKDSK